MDDAAPLRTHYEVIGVDPGASFAVIKAAYHRLALKLHPDRAAANAAAAAAAGSDTAFLELQAAWEGLQPAERRVEYDAELVATGQARREARRDDPCNRWREKPPALPPQLESDVAPTEVAHVASLFAEHENAQRKVDVARKLRAWEARLQLGAAGGDGARLRLEEGARCTGAGCAAGRVLCMDRDFERTPRTRVFLCTCHRYVHACDEACTPSFTPHRGGPTSVAVRGGGALRVKQPEGASSAARHNSAAASRGVCPLRAIWLCQSWVAAQKAAWSEQRSTTAAAGRSYWFNDVTGESVWAAPRILAASLPPCPGAEVEDGGGGGGGGGGGEGARCCQGSCSERFVTLETATELVDGDGAEDEAPVRLRVVVPTIAVCADHGTPHLCVQGECELIVKGTGANHGRRVCWATGRDHGVFHGDRSAPGTIAMRGAMRTVTYECVPELAESGGTVSVQVPEFAPALCQPVDLALLAAAEPGSAEHLASMRANMHAMGAECLGPEPYHLAQTAMLDNAGAVGSTSLALRLDQIAREAVAPRAGRGLGGTARAGVAPRAAALSPARPTLAVAGDDREVASFSTAGGVAADSPRLIVHGDLGRPALRRATSSPVVAAPGTPAAARRAMEKLEAQIDVSSNPHGRAAHALWATAPPLVSEGEVARAVRVVLVRIPATLLASAEGAVSALSAVEEVAVRDSKRVPPDAAAPSATEAPAAAWTATVAQVLAPLGERLAALDRELRGFGGRDEPGFVDTPERPKLRDAWSAELTREGTLALELGGELLGSDMLLAELPALVAERVGTWGPDARPLLKVLGEMPGGGGGDDGDHPLAHAEAHEGHGGGGCGNESDAEDDAALLAGHGDRKQLTQQRDAMEEMEKAGDLLLLEGQTKRKLGAANSEVARLERDAAAFSKRRRTLAHGTAQLLLAGGTAAAAVDEGEEEEEEEEAALRDPAKYALAVADLAQVTALARGVDAELTRAREVQMLLRVQVHASEVMLLREKAAALYWLAEGSVAGNPAAAARFFRRAAACYKSVRTLGGAATTVPSPRRAGTTCTLAEEAAERAAALEAVAGNAV